MTTQNIKIGQDYDFKVGSLNARGLNDVTKRISIFNYIKRNSFDVCYIQESYSSLDCEKRWKDEWGGHIVFSHGSTHSKGALILIKPNFDITIHCETNDENGRFNILNVGIQDQKYILINIYSPNKDKEKELFWNKLNQTMNSLNIDIKDNIIAGGDWNSIFNPELDKSGGKRECSNIASLKFFHIIDEFDLRDIWRLRNPTKKRFTFRQKTPLVQTRLDYFLISNNIQEFVNEADIIPSVWSDHSAISLCIKHTPKNNRGPGYWKFNSSMVEDKVYVADMNRKIKRWKNEYKNISDKRTVWELLKFEIRNYSMQYGARKKKPRSRNWIVYCKS